LNSFKEFIARRTEEDRRAMRARLRLLDHHDPKPIARKTRVPVYYLAGLFDALVPFPLVRRWLTRNCPGYRGGVTFWFSDHVVLTNAAQKCADQVWKWMNAP
jgi:pimeloyl-ACP methyl ester carboxylesterase